MGARMNFNPIAHLIGRQKIGDEDAAPHALIMLISLDAAKRSKGPPHLSNLLSMYLVAAIRIWHISKKKALYDEAVKAFEALIAACRRPTDLLDLTTTEYAALRRGVSRFVDLLPQIELGVFSDAMRMADAELNRVDQANKNKEKA